MHKEPHHPRKGTWSLFKISKAVFSVKTVIIVGAALLAVLVIQEPLKEIGQMVSVRVAPDAAKAYRYGDEHFSSSRGSEYNVVLAEKFFRIAAELDSGYPYVNHQLARIEFLKGNFNFALLYINKQIGLFGTTTPNSYYVRGLIEGFMGQYDAAADDYRVYVSFDPQNWAATNDLAWVLLKADRPKEAALAIEKVKASWPDNPWILNSYAIALHELGRDKEAYPYAQAATKVLAHTTAEEWLKAYPGNDPKIAERGVQSLRDAAESNLRAIELALKDKK